VYAAPLARRLIAANADRIIWGSDWPHPDSAIVPGRHATDIAQPLVSGFRPACGMGTRRRAAPYSAAMIVVILQLRRNQLR
jgi:Amidohydrolase